MKTQHGQALLAVVVLLGVLVFGYFLSQGALIVASVNRKYVSVEDQETRIKRALLQFVQINSRLPCPADPALPLTNANAGYPDANTAFPAVTSCTYPAGVVPWRALGLSLDDVTDPWGRFISYRVYDGSIGFTQTGGMSKVNCDTTNAVTNTTLIDVAGNRRTGVTFSVSETARSSAGLCNADTNTLSASFNVGKGLTVTDFGTPYTDVAYVLISHGPTGLGGYVPGGSRMTQPGGTAGDYNNTQSQQGSVLTSGAYVGFIKMARSLGTVTPGTLDHYDDIVDYLRVDDVTRLANVGARDWPESTSLASEAPIPDFSAATTTSDMSDTSTSGHFIANMTTSANSGRQFQQATASDGTIDGAVAFGAASGSYASCLWAPSPVDLYKAPTATVTNGTAWSSGSGGTITFKTATAHGLAVGDSVIVSGVWPTGYNATYAVASVPTTTTFNVVQGTNPGTWVQGGSVKKVLSLISSTWVGNSVTKTGVSTHATTAPHGLAVGDTVQISGAASVDFDGTFVVASVPSSMSFTVSDYFDGHAASTSGGTVTKGMKRALMVYLEAAFDSTAAGGGMTMGFLPTAGTYANATSSSAIALNPVLNVVSATALLGFATITLSGPPPFEAGTVVKISGVPALSVLFLTFDLNGTWTVNSVSGNSFTIGGLLSYPTLLNFASGGTVTSSLCGSAGTSRLGWDNASDGNLPSPRFAVELDLSYNSTRSDPSAGAHAAVDFTGVSHGSNAAACSNSSSTYHVTTDTGSSVTAASWSSSAITFITGSIHGLSAGEIVVVDGASPSAYNGTYIVASVVTTTQFTVAQSVNPGSFSGGGTVVQAPTNALVSGTSWSNASGTGTITFVTALPHNLTEGSRVAISGASPAGYNGFFTVTGTPSTTSFTATSATNPGSWVLGGRFDGNDCFTGSTYGPPSYLMNGISNFHSLRAEVEPRSPACAGSAPLLKFWLLPYNLCRPTATIKGGTAWSSTGGGTIDFVTTTIHGFSSGDSITVTGVLPGGYNGSYTILSVPNSTSFTVANSTDPGTWVSGGTFVSPECSSTAIQSMTAQYQPSSFPASGIHLQQCVPTPNPTNAYDSVYFGFTSNNTAADSTKNLILQKLKSGVISLP